MKTSLEHLPAEKQRELQTIVQTIREQAEVEMIILFGSYARGNWVEEYAEDGVNFQYQSDFDVLVIVKTHSTTIQRRLEYETMIEIENTPAIHTPVSVIVHDIDYINCRLEKAQFFFSDIKKQGIVLYDSGQLKLNNPINLTNKERYNLAKEDFEFYFNSAREFKIGFEFDFQRKSFNKAAFELHQVTERLYTTILLVFTRYKPNTHDLAILRRLVNALDTRFIKVFPLINSQEKYYFYLLRNAYVDARYKKTYAITEEELNWLAERVQALQKLTEVLCKEKMNSFLVETD